MAQVATPIAPGPAVRTSPAGASSRQREGGPGAGRRPATRVAPPLGPTRPATARGVASGPGASAPVGAGGPDAPADLARPVPARAALVA